MALPSVVVFDIDGTVTLSKQPLSPSMALALEHLLARTQVAIISGGGFEQLKNQVVEHLGRSADVSRLFVLPTSGGALYTYKNIGWEVVYEDLLTTEELLRITTALNASIARTHIIDVADPIYGERIEARGSQVTFSALGQQAPLEYKRAFDPDRKKRELLRAAVSKELPEFDVKQGGLTSIDITRRGINKAYGLRKLSEYLSIPIEHMLYVGDALFPGGNDEVVQETGVATRSVQDVSETLEVINELLA